jgi:cell wall-associated NlpC family hydrolase
MPDVLIPWVQVEAMQKSGVGKQISGFMQTRSKTRPYRVETLLGRDGPKDPSHTFEPHHFKEPEQTFESNLAETAGGEFAQAPEPTQDEEKTASQRMDHFSPERTPVEVKKTPLGEMGDFKLFAVDGPQIRNEVDVDFALGGNPGRYKYVPMDELWVEDTGDHEDMARTAEHELRECKLMLEGLSYDEAHERASEVEESQREKIAEPVLDDMSQFKETLVPGDILLTSFGQADPQIGRNERRLTLRERAFRAASRRIQGDTEHSAIYIGDGKVIETAPKSGAITKPLETMIGHKGGILAVRPKVPEPERLVAADRARELLGTPYSISRLGRAGLANWLKVAPEKVTDRTKHPYICSTLVSDAYNQVKFNPRKPNDALMPADFARSDQTERVARLMPKAAAAKEFAPGIPKGRVVQPITQVAEDAPNPQWMASLSHHPAARRGDHFDLRLVDEHGHAHSWAIPKMPEPGTSTYAAQQPTHSRKYALRTKPFEIPLGVYGGTRPGAKVEPKFVQPIEVISANDDRVHVLRHEGQTTQELVLRRIADQGGTPLWALHNATKLRRDLPTDKPKLKEIPFSKVDVNDDTHVLTPKIDGAHTLVQLPKTDKMIRTFSYRPTKRETGIIEHTFKFPGFQNLKTPKGLAGTVIRAETWGVDKETGKAIPASELGGILNSSVPRAREKLEAGKIMLTQTGIDVVKYKGRDYTNRSFDEKLEVLREVSKAMKGQLSLPDVARTPEEKTKMLTEIKGGTFPPTKEGVVAHPLAGGTPTKAKVKTDQDVHVRETFVKTTSKPGEAGGFKYSLTPRGPIVGSVGTGLSSAMRKDMLTNPQKYVGRVAVIQSMGRHEKRTGEKGALVGSPSFKSWHIDKTDPDLMKEGAKKKDDSKVTAKDIGLGAMALGGAGVVAHPQTRGSLLGFKRVYHGTSAENLEKVRNEGLLTSHGGRGGASEAVGSKKYVANSTGKVHVTSIKPMARFYSAMNDPEMKSLGPRIQFLESKLQGGGISEQEFAQYSRELEKKYQARNEAMKGLPKKVLNPLYGNVASIDMPYDQFHRFEIDPDQFGGEVPKDKRFLAKRFAARGPENIEALHVRGGGAGRALKRTGSFLKNLPKYVAAHPGRFAAGVGATALGTAGAIYGGSQLAQKFIPGFQEKQGSKSVVDPYWDDMVDPLVQFGDDLESDPATAPVAKVINENRHVRAAKGWHRIAGQAKQGVEDLYKKVLEDSNGRRG